MNRFKVLALIGITMACATVHFATAHSVRAFTTVAADSVAPDLANLAPKITRGMERRGWTPEQIQNAFDNGEQIPAVNKATGGAATRYINPDTGQSVVIDNTTGEVIHVGGPGFQYGPNSGDAP